MTMTPKRFRALVYRYYEANGRHNLPWRKTADPYRILVSEVMLQQTQAGRVVPYFARFLKYYPTIRSLARAPLGDVLRLWQGLGYNRRAKMLHDCVKQVVTEHRGRMPATYRDLLVLPGIGPYTAAAVMTFAYNTPVVLIETNVRTVFIHHFFPLHSTVRDAELIPFIESTLDTKNARKWYSALMDYGAHLKRTTENAGNRSAHHVKQSKFKGSDRQVRGAILRALAPRSMDIATLVRVTGHTKSRIRAQLIRLKDEGMVSCARTHYSLPV
jgi:A/G-specific adenine glycosylase